MNQSRTQAEPEAEALALVRQFGAASGEARKEPILALQARGAGGIEALLNLNEWEETQRSLRYRVAGLLAIGSVVGVALFGNAAIKSPTFIPLVFISLLFWLLSMAVVARALLPGKTEKMIRVLLSCLYETVDTPRAVGPLLEVYGEYRDENLNRWNTLALARLLAKFQKSDLRFLNPKQRAVLVRVLTHTVSNGEKEGWRDLTNARTDFVVSVLKAAPLLAERDTLSPLRRLADMKAASENQKRIQEAAKSVLPLLEAALKRA